MWLPPRHPPTLAALPWLVRKTCPGERPQLGDHCMFTTNNGNVVGYILGYVYILYIYIYNYIYIYDIR